MSNLKFGVGLRPIHQQDLLLKSKEISFLEIISENYMHLEGHDLDMLDKLKKLYPIAMHGVSLSIGSTDPLDFNYLKKLKQLADRVKPILISDHFCWTGVNYTNTHDLLPLPLNTETIKHIVPRIKTIQDYLGRQILLENPSCYLNFKTSTMPEHEFINIVLEQANCLLLFDINNLYINCYNFKLKTTDFINEISKHRVAQLHIAGHQNMGEYIIDTHGTKVINPVWDLYAKAIAKYGLVPTILERDSNIPPLQELIAEIEIAKKIVTNLINYEVYE